MPTQSPKTLVVFARGAYTPDLPDNPAAVLLTQELSSISHDLFDGLVGSLTAWDRAIKAGESSSQLYALMRTDVAKHQSKLASILREGPLPSAVVQGILQMWSSYILTWHVLRDAMTGAGQPASIEIARQLGGIVELPEGFSLPSVFLSLQGTGRPIDGVNGLRRSPVLTEVAVTEREGTAEEMFATERSTGLRSVGRKIAEPSADGALTPAGLSNIFRLPLGQIDMMDKGALFHLKTQAELCA